MLSYNYFKRWFECTVLEVNVDEFISKVEALGAKKVGDFHQKRFVYDFNPVKPGKWIRLRTNGTTTTLTIKEVVDVKEIGGTNELEVEVSDFENTNSILNELGYVARNFQENKRIQYILDDVEIDIDFWPMIPPYVEIEGKSDEDVKRMIKKLEINEEKVTTLDVTSIYNDIYNIDVLEIKELRF